MDKFAKLLEQYEYSDITKPGGFVIDKRPALTGVDPDLVGDYVIMVVRDPLLEYSNDPAKTLSKKLKDVVVAGKTGMFSTFSGYYKDAHISIVSCGSGCPEAELVLVELMHHTKANTFIRLGGGAGLNEEVKSGDVVIASGVVRDDGMTKMYIKPSYPAICSYELVIAFSQAAEDLGYRYHIGIGRSGDSEYVGCGYPSVDGYMQRVHTHIIDYYNRAGVLYWDRESSAIVTLTSLFGRRGGAVCSVDNNLITKESFTPGKGHDHAIDIVFEGLVILNKFDKEKAEYNKKYWVPNYRKVK